MEQGEVETFLLQLYFYTVICTFQLYLLPYCLGKLVALSDDFLSSSFLYLAKNVVQSHHVLSFLCYCRDTLGMYIFLLLKCCFFFMKRCLTIVRGSVGRASNYRYNLAVFWDYIC